MSPEESAKLHYLEVEIHGVWSRRDELSSVDQNGCAAPDGSVEAGLFWLQQVSLDKSAYTLKEIGQACGISTERVRVYEERALKKVRHRFRLLFGALSDEEIKQLFDDMKDTVEGIGTGE